MNDLSAIIDIETNFNDGTFVSEHDISRAKILGTIGLFDTAKIIYPDITMYHNDAYANMGFGSLMVSFTMEFTMNLTTNKDKKVDK